MGTRLVLFAATMSAALVLLAGCSSADEESAVEDAATSPAEATGADEREDLAVTFDGTTCAYDGPSEHSPGVLEVEFDNDNDVGGAALLLRLNEDTTFDEFADAHQPEPYLGELEDFGEASGVIGRLQPNDDGAATFPVQTGKYVLICLVDTDDLDEPASYLAHPVGVTVTE